MALCSAHVITDSLKVNICTLCKYYIVYVYITKLSLHYIKYNKNRYRLFIMLHNIARNFVYHMYTNNCI